MVDTPQPHGWRRDGLVRGTLQYEARANTTQTAAREKNENKQKNKTKRGRQLQNGQSRVL